MSEEWKQPAPLWVQAMPWALVVVVIVAAFFYSERERSRKQFDKELVLAGDDAGVPQVAYIETPRMTAAHWERIASLKTLRGIDFSNAVMIGAGVEQLNSLPNLRSLTMSGGAYVNDALIQRLTGIPTLQRLIVDRCNGVTDAAVDALVGCTSLEAVDVSDTSITLSGLIRLREARRDLIMGLGVHGLQIKNVYDPSGDPASRICLSTPADVESLKTLVNLPHNWRTGRWEAHPERQFTNLELTGDALGAALPELAAVFEQATSLTVSETHVTGDVGKWSDELTSLSVWGLADAADLSGFAKCQSLTSVSLDMGSHELEFTPADVEWLAELPDLRNLRINRRKLTLEEVEMLSGIDTLETLDLDNLSVETIEPLLAPDRLPRLQTLGRLYDWFDDDMWTRFTAAHPAATLLGNGFFNAPVDTIGSSAHAAGDRSTGVSRP